MWHEQNIDDSALAAVFNTASSPVACGAGQKLAGAISSVTNVSIVLDSSVPGGKATITVTGPATAWFGLGLGAQAMGDFPQVFVIDGNGQFSEHKLGDHEPGTLLPVTQAVVVSNSVKGGFRTVVLERSFQGVDDKHYTFDPTRSEIHVINAVGSSVDFSYHKMHGSALMHMTSVDATNCVCNVGQKAFLNGIEFSKNCLAEPNGDLAQQKNPTCTIQTYSGGLSCCHHGNILLDADQPVRVLL
jgi:hypothetical protein